MSTNSELWPFNLRNSNIWVVGGAGYLGQAVVGLLGRCGAKVCCIDMQHRAYDFVSSAGLDKVVTPITFDISNTGVIPAFVKEQVLLYGAPDGLVNLSFASTSKKLEELTGEDFDQANHTSLTATFIFAREVANFMIEKGSGSIVLFASMYGMVSPDPDVYELPMNKNPVEYGVGKAGIIQMTKYLAVHWAKKGIRCNCISPGPFPNPSVQDSNRGFIDRLSGKSPMGRMGNAEEIAGPVAFLLSDAAGYITGHNLVVDGGWTIW